MGYSRNAWTAGNFPESITDCFDTLGARKSRKLANNTYLLLDSGDGNPGVKLHATVVVRYFPSGFVRLDSGGWRTLITRDRINASIPRGWSVDSEKGVWYLSGGGKCEPYADGIEFNPYSGEVRYPKGVRKPDPKAELTLRKRVRDFAKNYTRNLLAGKVPVPSAGDCFGCALVEAGSTPESRIGKRHAGFGGADHLLSHIRERYYVPSLAFRAMEFCGAGSAHPPAVYRAMAGEAGEWERSLISRNLPGFLRKFIYSELGLAPR